MTAMELNRLVDRAMHDTQSRADLLKRNDRLNRRLSGRNTGAPKISITVVVPDLQDRDRATGYGAKRRLRRGECVPELVESLFSRVIVDVRRDHPQP